MKTELPNHEIVEVVLKKEMTYKHYKKIFNDSKKKGWSIQAYELRKFSVGTKNKIL